MSNRLHAIPPEDPPELPLEAPLIEPFEAPLPLELLEHPARMPMIPAPNSE
jgi:hypothetical protein